MDLRLGPSTPMTYLHRGRQYLVIAMGGGNDAEIVALPLPADGSTALGVADQVFARSTMFAVLCYWRLIENVKTNTDSGEQSA